MSGLGTRLFVIEPIVIVNANAAMDEKLSGHKRINRMPERRGVFLTGATGLLGQYLLQDLFLKEFQVTVLVRDSGQETAAERISKIVDFWSERLGQKLPIPTVVTGDLGQNSLGLSAADSNWISRHCHAVIHSAADLSFRKTSDGEPWRTNVEGTKSLIELCRSAGLSEWHQVSTAFVCGRRTGLIKEDDVDDGPSFHNPYEESKFHAEQLVRQAADIHATIYRPSIIIGDSLTGHTSTYTGLYRFLELAVHLASVNTHPADDAIPLRIPLNGDEPWNLVPVDWVSRAIVELLRKSQWHGNTFHLVSRAPISTRVIRDVGVKELNLQSVEFAGSEGIENPCRREEMFQKGIREYWSYLSGNPIFSSRKTIAALPELPPPSIDRPMLERMMRFAMTNNWGRERGASHAIVAPSQTAEVNPDSMPRTYCAEYIEQIFPRQNNRSRLAREAGLNLTACFDVTGPTGGQWTCRWRRGELVSVTRGLKQDAAVTYHTDAVTFQEVVSGLQTPQEAFFEQRINITGDMEAALKLTVLFGQFLAEERVTQPVLTDVNDATHSCV